MEPHRSRHEEGQVAVRNVVHQAQLIAHSRFLAVLVLNGLFASRTQNVSVDCCWFCASRVLLIACYATCPWVRILLSPPLMICVRPRVSARPGLHFPLQELPL